MPSIKSALVLLLGAMLVVGGVTAWFFDDRAYQHEVQSLDNAPENGDVYNYSDLSENAQTAFVQAHQAGPNGGTYPVYDEAKKPHEFEYLTDGTMSYTIRYQGNYYELFTSQTGGHGMGFERVIKGLLAFGIGVALLMVGRRVSSDRQLQYSVLGGTVIGGSVAFTGSFWPGQTAVLIAVFGGCVLCLLTTILTYTLLSFPRETRFLFAE
ncbi:hypothetical protein SAMN05216388_10702 [Halorientalis persicus]|uniref:DUF7979 domain-containing protein n=1 Tax=Halorientalis persicus TaxID=1367881 RepID=A0A1H8WQF4_9EURY|nr:hypothetical protein [Halorientalis persicus]SEP29856.1 hypothetical protein SAMN05216388_10702 [Halorientalis persicus]